MKNAIAFLAVSLFTQINFAQTSYITLGGGYLPHSSNLPWSQRPYWEEGTQGWYKSEMKSGYSFHIGFGKQLLLNEHWAVGGEWQFERFEIPEEAERIWYFQNNPEEVQGQIFFNDRSQYTGLRLGLSLERSFDIGQHEITLLAGGFLRPKLRGWLKYEVHSLQYFYVGEKWVWDSICQCNTPVFFISDRFDPPLENKGKDENKNDQFRAINYGIYGGIGFPIFTSPEGTMTGKVMVSKDLEPNITIYDPAQTAVKQTNISVGIVFKPTNRTQPGDPKRNEKPLPSGIYTGFSLHNLFYLSLDGSWQSSSLVGLDFSVRELFLVFDYSAVYIGPNCRLGNSRYFVKAGTEYLWRANSEASDEAFFAAHVGGKYLRPITKRFGLRFDAGYNFKRNTRQGYPGEIRLGIGLCFMPKV